MEPLTAADIVAIVEDALPRYLGREIAIDVVHALVTEGVFTGAPYVDVTDAGRLS